MATATERRTTVDYADFSGGEFGSLGSWAAPKGSFTGQNVVRYVDGSLGPRNGLKAYTLTGMPASAIEQVGMALPDRFFFENAASNWFYFNPTSMASQALPAAAGGTATARQIASGAGVIYYITSSNGIRSWVVGAASTNAVASSPSGTCLVKYGERLVAAGDSNPGRLYYSEAGAPTSWPASNFIDIGVGASIVALVPIRSGLAIVTQAVDTSGLAEGFRWYVLTGVPGVNDTVREVVQAQGPDWFRGATLLQNGLIAFAAPHSQTAAFFSGSQTELVRHLSLGTAGSDEYSVTPMRDESDVLFLTDVTASANVCNGYFRRDGVWLKQAFSEANVGEKVATVTGYDVNLVVFADKTSTPVFYAWQPYHDRPPFSGDTYATILSPSNVHFELPEWWAKDGEDVAVRKIIVSFKDWDTDDASSNQFDVTVTPLRTYGGASAGGEATAITKSWSRATSASSASGVNLRMDFGIEGSWGNGFKVKVANMRGVAIQKIQVVLHVRPIAGL